MLILTSFLKHKTDDSPPLYARIAYFLPILFGVGVLVGNLIWGVTGMILAIPTTGMVKVVLDNFPSLRPYGYLLGEDNKQIRLRAADAG